MAGSKHCSSWHLIDSAKFALMLEVECNCKKVCIFLSGCNNEVSSHRCTVAISLSELVCHPQIVAAQSEAPSKLNASIEPTFSVQDLHQERNCTPLQQATHSAKLEVWATFIAPSGHPLIILPVSMHSQAIGRNHWKWKLPPTLKQIPTQQQSVLTLHIHPR